MINAVGSKDQSIRNNILVKKNIESLLFIAVFIILYKCISLAVVDTNATTRLAYHEFYNQENIDMAVVGTSRVYMGFNPAVADDLLGINTFNLGTASQTLDGSYYQIKELLDRYEVDTIYLSVEYDILTRQIGGQKNTWIMTDYMKGINKYAFIFDVFERSKWLTMLSGVYRYRGDISCDYCLNNLRAKLNTHYWNYDNYNDYYANYGNYIGKGLASQKKTNEGYDYWCYSETYSQFDEVTADVFNEQMIEYIYKSIKLCKSRNVNIVLITMPETKFYINRSNSYFEFTEFMMAIADEYQILYYDFNLLSDIDFVDDEFINLDHLTLEGANHFTKVLCDIHKDGNSHDFVYSVDQKGYDEIIGIIYTLDELNSGEKLLSWKVETTVESDFLFRIKEFNKNGGTEIFKSEILDRSEIIHDFGSETDIDIEIYDLDENYLGKAKVWR